MVYETSYESGRMPFLPDNTRGSWSAPSDFIFACLGLALKMDILSLSGSYFDEAGFFAIIPYMLCLIVYIVPLIVIQSFMGQFSKSGYISSFRISPLFKGMGYVSLALNIAILTYYSSFAAIPLFYFFHSLRPTLPWSCEGFKSWAHNISEDEKINLCNIQEPIVDNDTFYMGYHVPSVLFFSGHFTGNTSLLDDVADNTPFHFSWQLCICTFLTWIIIAGIFYKFYSIDKFGKLLKYLILTALVLCSVVLMRVLFLPGSEAGLMSFFYPRIDSFLNGIPIVTVYSVTALGSGWGTIIALSSFNDFKTNIMSFSWVICLGQTLIFMLFGLISFILERHFEHLVSPSDVHEDYYVYVRHHWVLYLGSGSAFANMEWANMWSLLFYGMLFLCALIVMIIQLYTISVSVFDEFVQLRTRKLEAIMGLIGVLAFWSIYTSSSHGVHFYSAMAPDTVFTQTALNLLLLLVVLWIYGRERFQRDIEFMLNQRFSTWKVNILRYVAPIFLLFTLLMFGALSFYEHMFSNEISLIASVLFIGLPWLFIPGYCIWNLIQTTGSYKIRFQRCCRPTDWYPVDAEHRQRYEEAMGNMDITHQLSEVVEDVL